MQSRLVLVASVSIVVTLLAVALAPRTGPADKAQLHAAPELVRPTLPLGTPPSAGTVAPVEGNQGALTWTSGQPYPEVNGKPVPPPMAYRAHAPAASTLGGHWYAGSVYSGPTTNTSWVFAEISIPSAAAPDTSEFYYVILSIWDNNGSYDQIGFTDDYGTWGLAWSYTTGSCSSVTYYYSPDAVTLTPGQLYLFAITTHLSGGHTGVVEEAWSVSSTGATSSVYYSLKATGATDPGLNQSGFYCGYYDYTDYEEVYGNNSTAQPDPYGAPGGFVWFFHDNLNYTYSGPSAGYNFVSWSAWKTGNAPPGTHAAIGKYATHPELVTVYNYQSLAGYKKG